MNIEAYFKRIGLEYDPAAPRDAELLRALQCAHVTSVPYENLDILAGIPLDLAPEAVCRKIVERGRGGYCFELNGAFGYLLRALGFRVVDCFARFLLGELPGVQPMRRHRVLLVDAPDGRYICDVGCGCESPRYPLKLVMNGTQEQPVGAYRVVLRDAATYVVQTRAGGEWLDFFSFTEEPQFWYDYQPMSWWCEHHPTSTFNRQRIVSLKSPDGRIGFDGDTFHEHHGDAHASRVVPPDEIPGILREDFGIVM